MNESIKNLLERRSIRAYKKRTCSERNSGYDPGSRKIFPQRHGTAEHSYGSDTGSGAGCEAFQNERSCYGQHLRSVLRAPTVIIVFSDSKMGTCVENGSLVMGNLMNAAHALGVDSCWIHRAREVFDSEEGKELKKQWGVPEEYIGVGHCVLGYRDCEYPTAKPRKDGFCNPRVIVLQIKFPLPKTFNVNKNLTDSCMIRIATYLRIHRETALRYHKYQKLFPSSPAVICQILFSLISVLYPYIWKSPPDIFSQGH